MPKKLNGSFCTPYDIGKALFSKGDDRPILSGYGSRYHDGVDDTCWFIEYPPIKPFFREHEPENRFYYGNQLKGMFHPLSKMKKYLIDTGYPYYSREKIFKDAAQLFYGFKNLFDGLFTFLIGILGCSLSVAILLPLSLLCICAIGVTFRPLIAYNITTFSWVVEGLLNMIRGITQIITAPLTYGFKLPLRMLLTRCSRNYLLLAEEKYEIQRLAKSARQYLKKIKPVEEKLIPLINQEKALMEKAKKKKVLAEKYKEVMPVIEGLLEGVEKELGETTGEQAVQRPPTGAYDIIAENRHFRESVYIPMRMIYEVHRKYEKSIRRGWESHQPRAELKHLFHRCFSVFTESIANNELHRIHYSDDYRLYQGPEKTDEFIQTASQYLYFFR